MKKQIPNFLTCMNLFSGCIALVMVFRNHLEYTAYLILIAAFFDLLDGMVARKVGSNSEFGKQIDSLADMVSFGLVPGAVMFKLLQMSSLSELVQNEMLRTFVQFVPFIITIFSALRLAKFNLDTRQTSSFIGLPTPANTLLIVSLPLILIQRPGQFDGLILNPVFILFVSMFLSYMLISEIPLFALKFKSLDFKANIYQYILIALAIVLIAIFSFVAIPMVVILYVLLSIIKNKLAQ